MNEREFGNLVESINANGFCAHEPITLHEGMILDGRNRALACEVAKVEPIYTDLPSGVDPLQFVITKNLHPRHLNESQRAVVAAKIATMKHGGDRKSDQDANLQVDRATAANMLNVSERSVANAAKVQAEGTPELVSAVERGDVAVSTAAVVTELPQEEQRKAVAGGKKAVGKAARQIKAKKAQKAGAAKAALDQSPKGNQPKLANEPAETCPASEVPSTIAQPTGAPEPKPEPTAEPSKHNPKPATGSGPAPEQDDLIDEFCQEWARSSLKQLFERATEEQRQTLVGHICRSAS
jgi:hypothetical protein